MKFLLYWTFVLVLLWVPTTQAKILFEGFFKIEAQGQHIGYYIQRYELDPKKKQFISTYFLRTNPQGGSISESLKFLTSHCRPDLEYVTDSLYPTGGLSVINFNVTNWNKIDEKTGVLDAFITPQYLEEYEKNN